jgi:hypothetical protein
MTYSTFKTLSLATCATLLATGCAQVPARTDIDFGKAVKAAMSAQTINPEGVHGSTPAPGMQGAAARATIDRYEKSFESPAPPANIFTIGVGNASTSSSASR